MRRLVAGFALLLLPACEPGETMQTDGSGSDQSPGVEAQAQPLRGNEPLFASIAATLPEFAGFFVEAERFVLLLTDVERADSAEALVEAAVGGTELERLQVEVRPAQFTFNELRVWRDRAMPLLDLPGVHALSLNEAVNRVTIYLAQEARARVLIEAAGRGIPEEALRLEVLITPFEELGTSGNPQN